MQTTFHRHLAAIESGRVTKTNIIGIRKALNNMLRIEHRLSPNRCNVTVDQAIALHDALIRHRPIVIGEMVDSGIKVLTNRRYAKRWTEQERAIVDDIDSFRLVGYEMFERECASYPIYSVSGCNGDSFRFINIPWQSGGNGPEPV